LIKAREDADTIVVARVNNQNKLRIAKPCACCSLALEESGVKKIYYSTDDGFVYNFPVDRFETGTSEETEEY